MGCCNETTDEATKALDRSLLPKLMIVCIFLSFAAMIGLYSSLALFLHSRLHDMQWISELRTNPVFEKVRNLINYSMPLERQAVWTESRDIEDMFVWSDEIHETVSRMRNKTLMYYLKATARGGDDEDESEYDKLKAFKAKYLEARKNLERTSKTKDRTYLSILFFICIFANFWFILPFLFRLRIQFRSRIFKLGSIYIFMFCVCILNGLVQILAIFEIDLTYVDFENLALKDDEGAILLASCHITPYNEFDVKVKKKNLLKKRKDLHVCQDWPTKLLSALLMVGCGFVQLFVGIRLIIHFKSLVRNRIFPPEESQAMMTADEQNDTVTTFLAEDKMIYRQRILEHKDELKKAKKEKEMLEKLSGLKFK